MLIMKLAWKLLIRYQINTMNRIISYKDNRYIVRDNINRKLPLDGPQ